MMVRSLIPAAALALAFGGSAAALPIVPSTDTALPLIFAQTEDLEARLRAAEERVAEAEEALRQAEEELDEVNRTGGDLDAAQDDVDAARVELEAAVVDLRIAEEALQAAEQAAAEEEPVEELAEPEPEPEPEQLAEPEPEPEPEQLAEPEIEPEPEPEELAEPEAPTLEPEVAEPEPEIEAERLAEPEPEPEPEQLAEPEPQPEPEPQELAEPEAPAAEPDVAEPETAPIETQEAQPDEREPAPREGRPSLRERIERAEEPAAEPAPADEPRALTETEPAVDESPVERQERRARRDRQSLQERAEERERTGRERPEAERVERQRPDGAAPGYASELPDDAQVLRREAGRVIIRRGDQEIVRKDETERMRRFSREVRTERIENNWTRTVAVRRGVQVITVWDEYGDIVERVRVYPDGRRVVMIDTRELRRERGPRVHLDIELPPLTVTIPRERYIVETRRASRADIYAALTAPPVEVPPRVFTLQEVRENERVRDMVPRIDVDTITFEFDSAAIPADQLDALDMIGQAMEEVLDESPEEIFLIEGHTDAVGSELYNLALSDRRAESVAFALSEYFDIPPENLETQGYGEQFLKIPTQEAERENRRVTIRRVTPLVGAAR
jgi:outer membrane protein OmpA-like peptidoglycan-associated protein